jgi:glycerol kinase
MGFSLQGETVALEQQTFEQIYPAPGWVEHDAEVIWATVLSTARKLLAKLNEARSPVAAIGITNQRETTIVWDRRSGVPIFNAIVWQDRRTAERCRELNQGGVEAELTHKTGLLLDPYFSSTKIAWILDRVPGAREAARAGHLAFGTVDSFLIWRLTGGRLHVTDATNASRTALYDIRRGRWDEALCELFDVPMACLPEVRDTAGDFDMTDAAVLGEALPIRGVAGDQQAALDSVVYQTYDLLDAMAADGMRPVSLKVDGGMAQNGLFMQRLADILSLPILRPRITESTAFGAACLAGLGGGIYGSLDDIAALAHADARFEPALAEPLRDAEIAGWRGALRRVRSPSRRDKE